MPISETYLHKNETDAEGRDNSVPRLRTHSFKVYLLVLFLAAVFFYPLPFFLVRMPSFERWGGSQYGPALDYGFQNDGTNADVVIFGDSSALHGLAPLQMSAELRLKVINLPNTSTSLGTYDDFVLTRYLQHNRPPRLIVFFFTPWNFDYRQEPPKAYFEGEEMLLRYGTPAQIWHYDRHHIVALLEFPFQFLASVPRTAGGAFLRHQDRVAMVASSLGHLDTQGFRDREQPGCAIIDSFVRRNGIATLHDLVTRFHTPRTKTIAVAAPIPACTNAPQVLKYPFASVPGEPPRVLAPDLFIKDGFYTHLGPDAVPDNTTALVRQLRPLLAVPPAGR